MSARQKAKALGAALVAVLAIGAVAAQGAAADLFESEAKKTVVTGHAEDIYELNIWGDSVTCEEETLEGTIEAAEAKYITVRPTYKGCEESVTGGTIDVDTEGCFYKFGTETTETEGHGLHASVEIECLEGHTITLLSTSTGCDIEIHGQGPLHGVTYTTGVNPVTQKEDVTITSTVTGIHYTTSFICQLGGLTATDTDGEYYGAITLVGYEDAGEPHGTTTAGTTYTEGEPVDIRVNTTF